MASLNSKTGRQRDLRNGSIASARNEAMRMKFTIACIAPLAVGLPNQSRAQFTGNNQTNIISGVTSNWASTYYVGSNYAFDALCILNGGVLISHHSAVSVLNSR